MRILCAPASFKETLTASQAAQAMAAGVRRADPNISCDLCPVADGGEGTLEVLVGALGGAMHETSAVGPLGAPIRARCGLTRDRIAIVELAQASGLMLVPQAQRDPMKSTTYGTGQVIDAAINRGCDSIIVGIGGSATIDGGTGIAQALGARFFDRDDREITQPMCGGLLNEITRIEPPQRAIPPIRVACDVTNPLCGPRGAAAFYGPQKGAAPEQVRVLDQGLANFARIVGSDPNHPGAGAAGGAGFGLAALCGGRLERGIELVLDAIHLQRRCAGASLVLTGEGRLDEQSLQGKACMGVAAAAAALNVPTIAIVGGTGPGADKCLSERGGFLKSFVSLSDRFGRNRSLHETASLIAVAVADVIRPRSG